MLRLRKGNARPIRRVSKGGNGYCLRCEHHLKQQAEEAGRTCLRTERGGRWWCESSSFL